jgi:hypothetical protein
MGSLADYAENKVLDDLFISDWTKPTNYYFALYTANPTDSSAGTEVSTGNWTNYARIAKARGSTHFNTAASGITTNKTLIDFGTATTTGTVTVTGMAIMDASTAGNMIGWAALTTSKGVTNGDPVSFAIAAVSISLD